MAVDDPHADLEVETAGAPLSVAEGAVLMLHGRGATAAGMLQFATDLHATGVAFLALQAVNRTWYPDRFVAPIERNEPHLSSALAAVDRVLADLEGAGVPAEHVVLLGFSQGACLASEYVARDPRRYGGLAVLSGGLVGPTVTEHDYREAESPGSRGPLDGTPVYLGCGDRDPHIPVERVHETRDVLTRLGGNVTERIFEGMGHGIVEEETDRVRVMVRSLTDGDPPGDWPG